MLARYALAALPALAAVFGFIGGCSKSECLREDCATSAPGSEASRAGSPGSNSGSAGASSSAGGVKKCRANADCNAAQGQSCVAGTCRVTCGSHYDCQGFGECLGATDSDGNPGHFCDLSRPQAPGQFYTRCPNGDSECDTDHGFACIGAGGGDLDAYCTLDCKKDAECADGFACMPLIRSPCEDACGVSGVPKIMDAECVPLEQIGEGKAYQCEQGRGATRRVCRPREFCSTCDSDADCFAVNDQICAKDESGTKICTQRCDPKLPSCPWGTAAKCGVWDDELGVATCEHRFGQCIGTGQGCEPCLQDADCGANNVCTSSQFTGEHWCVDYSVRCNCPAGSGSSSVCTGGGCPKSPGGLTMQCNDSTTGQDGVCIGADTDNSLLSSGSPQTGCWPAK